MIYISTRGQDEELSFEEVLVSGLARDGGLYVPKVWPKISKEEMASSVYNYLNDFFADRNKNEREGLAKQYIKLKSDVINNKVVGSILWAADSNNLDREISRYTTSSNTEITLMTDIICKNLLEEYIRPENVDELCKISIK